MVQIQRVKTRTDLRKFVEFGNVLYKDNPFYVPDLVSDSLNALNPKRNPAFEFCETEFFLAYKEKQMVGRIGVILNKKSNEKWHQKYVRFTSFDFIDDLAVSQALMDAAHAWTISKGLETLHGPLGFTDLDHQGMLVEGFEELDLFITLYNAPYYQVHMEGMGFVKDVDWVECQLKLDSEKAKRLNKISEYLKKRSDFKLIEFEHKKDLLPWAPAVFDLYNTAYAPLYGMTALTEKQIQMYIKTFFGFVNPDFIKVIVDKDDKLAAFSIAMPSLSKAMQKAKGKLLPFGFYHILKAIKENNALDLYLIAVKPEYQNTGINGLILDSVIHTAQQYGMTIAETGPMLETNEKVQAQWKFFDVRQHRRRRIWKKDVNAF